MADVEVELTDGVMVATINRPKRMNSLSAELAAGLLAAIERSSEDDDVRVMLLTGAGRSFCAGAEVSADRAPAGGSGSNGNGTGVTPARSRRERMNFQAGSAEIAEALARCDVPTSAESTASPPAVGSSSRSAATCESSPNPRSSGRSSSSVASPRTMVLPTSCRGSWAS
jgi:hypothetical protein